MCDSNLDRRGLASAPRDLELGEQTGEKMISKRVLLVFLTVPDPCPGSGRTLGENMIVLPSYMARG